MIKLIKNRLILIITGCLLASGLFGQLTFNVRHYYEAQTEYNSINISDSGYIVSGWNNNIVGGGFFQLLLTKFNMDGTISNESAFGEMNRQFWAIDNSNSYIPNYFIQQSTGHRNDTLAAQIVLFNELADTTFSKDFRSIHLGDGSLFDYFISPIYCIVDVDSTIYVTFTVAQDETYTDALLYKLDPSGQEIWHYEHATASDPDIIYGLVPHEGGVIYTCYHAASVENAFGYHEIIKLDGNGQLLWSLDSRDYLDFILSAWSVSVDNDSIVVCGSRNEIIPTQYGVASIYKVDTLGNLIWSNTFGEYNDYDWRIFSNLTQTTDGHYVCGGTWTTEPGSEEIPEGELSPDYDQFAHNVKFDRNNGDIIWERKYRWLETYHDRHNLYDMKATPDGGLIFCGSAVDLYQFYDPPLQQGWVVKLDECGCLVPGCDVSCEVGVQEEEELLKLKIGPNPTSDLLNIFIGESTQIDFNALQLEVTDLFGRVIQQNPIKYSGTTYIFDVSNYAEGQYVVSLVLEGSVLASEKFIVKK